jgi:regulator of sirC expression with transglutaminase-like and TPR domain
VRPVPKTQGRKRNQNSPKFSFRRWSIVFFVLTIAAIAGGLLYAKFRRQNRWSEIAKTVQDVELKPNSLTALLAFSPAEIEHCDIARLNLLCAEGLKGAESVDVEKYLARLDEMARHVEAETKRHFYKFVQNKSEYNDSEGFFRCLALVTVLQQDFGIRYNPDHITAVGVFEPNDSFFADSRDTFLHGLIGEAHMGTCSSLPVLYVAVGRRLGYPLKLVTAKNHLFVRWDDPFPNRRFNLDATGQGMTARSDAYYRQWPFPISAKEEAANGFLKSLTASEELAVFLDIRGHCLMATGHPSAAVANHALATHFAPNCASYQSVLAIAQREALMRSQPAVALPPDPIFQTQQLLGSDPAMIEAEMAGRRAEAASQTRRGE